MAVDVLVICNRGLLLEAEVDDGPRECAGCPFGFGAGSEADFVCVAVVADGSVGYLVIQRRLTTINPADPHSLLSLITVWPTGWRLLFPWRLSPC